MKKTLLVLALITVLMAALLGCNIGGSFDNELKIEIIEDYLIWSGIMSDKTVDEIDYECFGTYGDSIAIYFHTAGAYETPVEEKIAGYKFSYPDSRVIRIWNNGKFYKMTEAYELGLINYFDILIIKTKSLLLKFEEPYFIYQEKNLDNSYSHLYAKPELYYLNELKVFIDPGLCKSDYSITMDFFNSHELIKSIERYEFFNEDYGKSFVLYLHSNTIGELISVKEYIEQIDGVRRVEFVGGWELAAHTNDTYYLSDDLWAINSINVDRVWDFVTGRKSFK